MMRELLSTEQHHWAGPSRLPRLHRCPGSHRLTRDLPEEDSDYLRANRRIHEAIARRAIGLPAEDLGEDQHLVERALEWLESCFGVGDADYEVLLCEEWLPLRMPGKTIPRYGKVDLVISDKEGTIHVIDWKRGRQDISEDYVSLQLIGYSVCAKQLYGDAPVRAHVFLLEQGREISGAPFSDVLIGLSVIQETMRAAQQPNAPLRPGVEQCEYCPARGSCPALEEQSLKLVERNERLPTDPKALGELYDRAKQAEVWLKAFFREVRERAANGGPEPAGWRLVSRAASATIDDTRAAYERLQAVFTPEQFVDLCRLKMAELRRAYAEATGLPAGHAAKELEAELEGVIKRAEGIQYLRRSPSSPGKEADDEF